MRRIGEQVVVRTVKPDAAAGEAGDPSTFLWRGRVYVVREVLGHWQERRAWWTSGPARALHGEETPAGTELARPVPDPPGAPDPPAAPGTRVPLNHECEVWRVEASAGRTFGSGVYDLCRDAPAPAEAQEDDWRLLRITD